MTSRDKDLRTALHKAVSKALHNNQFADGWPEMVDPVVDAVLALAAPPRPDHAGGVNLLEGQFWLELREPKRVPERKGPWPSRRMAVILREFMEARPEAYITVVTVTDNGPDFEDGPQALQEADGRSMSTGRKHIARTREAHDGLRPAQAPDKAVEREGLIGDRVRILADDSSPGGEFGTICNVTYGIALDGPDGPMHPMVSQFLDTERDGFELLAPKPTGTEAKDLTWPASYQETFDAIGKAVTWHPHAGLSISVHGFYRALGFTKRPTGIEAGRGVGAIPAGWKLVPVEPTQAMWAAFRNTDSSGCSFWRGYRAMLAATPTPPTPDSTAQGGGTSQEGAR